MLTACLHHKMSSYQHYGYTVHQNLAHWPEEIMQGQPTYIVSRGRHPHPDLGVAGLAAPRDYSIRYIHLPGVCPAARRHKTTTGQLNKHRRVHHPAMML